MKLICSMSKDFNSRDVIYFNGTHRCDSWHGESGESRDNCELTFYIYASILLDSTCSMSRNFKKLLKKTFVLCHVNGETI